jgi:hypothetical protein
MQVLNLKTERNLQALQLHYENTEVEIGRLFADFRTSEELVAAVNRESNKYHQDTSIPFCSDHK